MAVRKQCKSKGCKTCPKCEHPWWLDYQHKGRRYRMPVDDFAIPRMAEGAAAAGAEQAGGKRLGTPVRRGDQGRTRPPGSAHTASGSRQHSYRFRFP